MRPGFGRMLVCGSDFGKISGAAGKLQLPLIQSHLVVCKHLPSRALACPCWHVFEPIFMGMYACMYACMYVCSQYSWPLLRYHVSYIIINNNTGYFLYWVASTKCYKCVYIFIYIMFRVKWQMIFWERICL